LLYVFEDFVLDTDKRELRRGANLVSVAPQVFDVLDYLIRNRERVVSKADLVTAIWQGRIISDAALTTRLKAVRNAIGDSGEGQRLIKTLPRKGFRFVGKVQEEQGPGRRLGGGTPLEPPRPALALPDTASIAVLPFSNGNARQAQVLPPDTIAAPCLPDRPSIAVLPFSNISGDPQQEYFADGMVDDILVALSRVHWLFVIARQSSFLYKARAADVQQIGRELGVRYVVEGSVRKAGNRVRIVSQLIGTETGAHIWADRYEGDLRDIFALQDEITERIVAAVEEKVQAAEIKRSRAKPTDSLTAYDLYLHALPAYFGQTEVDYKRTQALLGKALEADSEYPEVLGTLTDSVTGATLLGWQGNWSRAGEEAFQLAGRALAAGPDNSTCVVSAAFTYGVLLNRFEEAQELADRALMLHPNSVLVRNRVGAVYTVCGESDKAIAQCEAARRMNPLDGRKAATATFTVLTSALYLARRYEESIDAGRRALALAPQANTARKYVAISLAQLGRIEEARADIAELIKHQPGASQAWFRQRVFPHKWMQELHMEGLRKAGLREE